MFFWQYFFGGSPPPKCLIFLAFYKLVMGQWSFAKWLYSGMEWYSQIYPHIPLVGTTHLVFL